MSDNVTTHDKTYNGWSNYETWLVNLWWDQCESTVEIVKEYTTQAINDALEEGDGEDASEVKFDATYRLSLTLEGFIEDLLEDYIGENCGLFTDLLRSAVQEVNFYEIAQHAIFDNWDSVYQDYRDNNS